MLDFEFISEANQLEVLGRGGVSINDDDQLTIYLGKCSKRWKDCKEYCEPSLPTWP